MTRTSPRAVAIGASAGAVQALLAILPALPASFPLPILVVVHVPPITPLTLRGRYVVRRHRPIASSAPAVADGTHQGGSATLGAA